MTEPPLFDLIAANASLIVAICALVYTAYEVRLQRSHNRLSVRPHIAYFTYRNRSDAFGELRVELLNNGLGPAFIKSFQAYLDQKPCDLRAAVALLLRDTKADNTVMTLGSTYAMAANEAKDLLKVKLPCGSDAELDAVAKELDRIDVTITYHCGYGTEYQFDSRTSA